MLLYVYPQVYALKEYVNDEYNIRFQYPDEWQILDQEEEVFEIENDIRIDLFLLRIEQKEEKYQIGEPIIAIQVYPEIDSLKQLSKQVIKELHMYNHYDIIDYKKKYIGDSAYLNITYNSTPKMDIAKLNITDLLYYYLNTGYRISYAASPDFATANTKNHQFMNDIFRSITQSVSNNKDYSYTPTTTNNITDLLFERYYPIVKVDYESDSMIVLEGNKNYLSQINGTFDPFWESIDVVKNEGYSLKEITTAGTEIEDNPPIIYAVLFNNSKVSE